MQSPVNDSFEQMLNAVKPLHISTPTGNSGPDNITTTMTKTNNVECDINRYESVEKSLEYDHNNYATTSQHLINNEKLGVITRRHPNNSITVSAAKIFFSLLLFWLLLIAVAISLFEHDSPWLNSIPALDSVRHIFYEPLRHYILALYVRLGRH
ncbi:Ferm domain (protein4.1-ezrin-radixin-moesin) family protein 4-like [Brugia malayi]|nr:Ferm domain (protein4.1-ezrin-radixin-moesin) family protein 4-like [Brugia malayi]CDP97843.1 BMA-FRM-4, isoform k [Brugia malayi]VIO95736.1 Ferm domain (protein4.1-ezrin-radixin-moesin) family protein 4-like [Brugia malayi]